MGKSVIEKNLFCLPWTQTLLGTHVNGRSGNAPTPGSGSGCGITSVLACRQQ